ncbi:FAD-dependent oxidoreductase [Streptomyces sp. 8ZJF_21]|uniref:FAD-dependent oxidoreductase n=1 Tax=Streptomyces sp. 8ZJF_21 TaxID=2903141 RepID=UPI001E48A280|nr:FAD-dependent oxidoreductase [Streptomyces sp. 8ZJF_21]MCD9591933.1 FAD-dependent oxidoreductase [Streptomyces sp. 8ZJF_21]
MARQDDTEVRVAVVGPFSGPRAAWGELLTRAAADHGDPGVVWEFHDDRGDADAAEGVARALTAEPVVRAVIGHFNSLGAARALPHYRRAGLPVLLPLATDPDLLASGGGGALRWCPHDLGQPAAIRRAAQDLGIGTLAAVDDGSPYGRRLAERFAALSPDPAATGQALVVCGTHHGAADTARRLRADGHDGPLFFTDDCAVAEFADLLGDQASSARVVRLRGGPRLQVEAAFAALVRALRSDPAATGDRLLAAVRAAARLSFDADGDPVDADDDGGWEVVPVALLSAPAAPRPTGAPVTGYDVVVVGAGAVGAATAAELASAGLTVAVADLGPGAGSATRASGGLVRAYEPEPVVRALAVRSHQLLWGTASPPRSAGFRRTGSVVLLGPDDVAEAERGIGELSAAGIKADLLTPRELSVRWPDLAADGVAAAVWEPGGGYADPVGTAALYLTRALRHGAVLLPPGPVHALEPHRRGVRVCTPAGELTARCAVVAAGGGTPALLGDRLPPRPGGPAPRTKRIRYAFFRGPGRPLPAVSDLTCGIWGRPQLDEPFAGGQLTGRPVEEWDVSAGAGDTLTDEQVAHIRAGVVHRWPWVSRAPYLGGRFGADLYHPDGPFLGLLPGEPPVVVAACWSGAGFKTAPGAAEEAAAAVRCLPRWQGATP